MNEVFDLFPTLVMRFSNVFSQDELDGIFNTLKGEEAGSHDALIGRAASSYWSENSNLLFRLNIQDKIQKCIDGYTIHLQFKNNVVVENSWFNIQDIGSSLKMHRHQHSLVSGALYINVDEKSSPLCFENPNSLGVYENWNPGFPSKYTAEICTLKPQRGEIVLFPSWLRHGSLMADEGSPLSAENHTIDRTVISFNAVLI